MSSATALRDGLVRKIVKDAVGVEVVLPPRSATDEDACVRHSADTHPLLEPYRAQGNVAPRLATFGHRPSSASRVFNPSTMGVTDRSSSQQRSGKDKPELLMSASVLRQILPEHNTRQHSADSRAATASTTTMATKTKRTTGSPEQQQQHEAMPAYPEGEEIPTIEQEDVENDRPAWDDDFLLKPSAKARYSLKSHVMVGEQNMTMREKLDRFVSKATAMEADTIYCKAKRELDRHFNKMQYDAAYRASQEKAAAEEQRRLQTQRQQEQWQPSQETLVIQEIVRARRKRERMLENRVREYVHEQRMNAVPEVNYDGALFNAAFKKTLERGRAFSSQPPPPQMRSQQQLSSEMPVDKQSKMCAVYSEEPQTIEAFTTRRRRTQLIGSKSLPSLSSSTTASVHCSPPSQPQAPAQDDAKEQPHKEAEKSQFQQYIESQPSVEAIIQQALRGS